MMTSSLQVATLASDFRALLSNRWSAALDIYVCMYIDSIEQLLFVECTLQASIELAVVPGLWI